MNAEKGGSNPATTLLKHFGCKNKEQQCDSFRPRVTAYDIWLEELMNCKVGGVLKLL
jgi:hypothetical protein